MLAGTAADHGVGAGSIRVVPQLPEPDLLSQSLPVAAEAPKVIFGAQPILPAGFAVVVPGK